MSFINHLNQVDLLILLITVISMIYGYLRGLLKEVLSILSIFLSGFLSALFYPDISIFIKQYVDMDLLSDGISFVVLFVIIYSLIGIFANLITHQLNKTPLKIFDKNFGIIFGFFRSVLIFSLLNIFLNWIIWKKNIPNWINDAKSMVLINYTSKIILDNFPKANLKKIMETFNIERDFPNKDLINRDNIDKYNEPIIDKSLEKNNNGYSDNDNNSLDRLFNIENSE